MSVNLTILPPRRGTRPTTTGVEIPHEQLDDFSPPETLERLVAYARALPGVFTGPSLISEPSSLGLRLPHKKDRRFEAFLHPSLDEFGHIHRAGFLHLTVPLQSVGTLEELGWIEVHPVTRRPDFPDSLVMLYAPRNNEELEVVASVLQASYEQALQ